MTCATNKPFYIPPNRSGIKLINSLGTGIDMELFWHQAYVDNPTFKLAYNIYFSTEEENVFNEGPKYLSTNLTGLYTKISIFNPGDTYYFAVKATEYDPTVMNVNFLPDSLDGYLLKTYPETLLASDISATSTVIPITDINLFPANGVIVVGYEYIRYDSKDIPDGTLLVAERGYLNTNARDHSVSGFDGYVQQSPIIRFWMGLEDSNTLINEEEAKFDYPNFPYTVADGYRTDVDLLTTNLASDSTDQITFPSYPAQGYRAGATELMLILNGQCLNSYIGGESGCSDDYNVGMQIRNVSITDVNDQRQELLLSYTGEKVVLVNRLWEGVVCACKESNKDSNESRCPLCLGTGFVMGYQQFYNPRDSSGKILVRFGPYTDTIRQDDSGLESVAEQDCWTLSPYILKDRDFIIRFDPITNLEEFRYQIINVNRNKLLFGMSGNQHFKAVRVRKTDPIYNFRVIRDTSTMPHFFNSTVGLLLGANKVPQPHIHTVNLNENILTLSQINQTTSVSLGHNHFVINGVIQPSPIDNHSHQILF